jgi:hypothetical protein
MQLSQHDLSQLDRDAICALSLEGLQALTLKLLADLIELHERLNQNPTNSSRPPSSQAPWEGSSGSDPHGDDDADGDSDPANAKDRLQAEGHEGSDEPIEGDETDEKSPRSDSKKPGKPGKREGAPGYGRSVELAVHAEQVHRPEQCARCGAAFSPDSPSRAYTARHEIDLIAPSSGSPGLELFQTKHLYLESQCSCGHWSRAKPGRGEKEDGWRVELTEWHLVGPMLVALICALSLRMRISRRGIREFLGDWLGVALSIGCINQCIHEAGRAVEPVVQRDIIPEIRQAPLVHGDETGWKEGVELLWLWVFTCATATVFCIGRRSRETVLQILGKGFAGWLMSDGLWVYRDYDQRLHCLAHLMRKARGLEQSLNRQAQQFGAYTLLLLANLLDQVYQAREGPDPPENLLYQQNLDALNAFRAFCENHWDAEHEKTQALAREFLNDWDAIWAVLDYPWLPLTNNAAEQALRHWVIARRISFGTRTAEGSLAFTLLASVIETCRQRHVSPWPYIAEVVRQRRKGEPAPVLPSPRCGG